MTAKCSVLHHASTLLAALGVMVVVASASASWAYGQEPELVRIEKLIDIEPNIKNDDSLADVFPMVNGQLYEGRLASALVDGWIYTTKDRWRRSSSAVLRYNQKPAFITFDLGRSVHPGNAQLDEITVWLSGKKINWQRGKPTFHGQLLISRDGRTFHPIPDSEVRLVAPDNRNYDAIVWRFEPKAVSGFRFLRVEMWGRPGERVRIEEIDAIISGVEPEKSTVIRTSCRAMAKADVKQHPPKTSQTVPEPMRVENLRFEGTDLIWERGSKKALRLAPMWAAGDEWRARELEVEARKLQGRWERADGLSREINAVIGADQRLTLTYGVSLPKTAPEPVSYDQINLPFGEAEIRFDGVSYVSSIAYFPERKTRTVQLGAVGPYLVYPSARSGLELHMFMPDIYNAPGICKSFNNDILAEYTMYTAVDNWIEDIGLTTTRRNRMKREWSPAPGKIHPGEQLRYQVNVGLFQLSSRRTLGQIDIEDRPPLHSVLININTGVPDQAFDDADYRISARDKMEFMGIRLPPPSDIKPGHMINDTPHLLNQSGIVDRLRRAGAGAVCLMGSDYVDVSHGISYEGDYDEEPPELRGLIDKLVAADIRPIYWFSPRGFLQEPWKGRAADKMVSEHPNWFMNEAHWHGKYRTVDTFKLAPNQWIIDKIRSDFGRYPTLGGIAFDTFPRRPIYIGIDEITKQVRTGVAQEQHWLRKFREVVKEARSDAWVLWNSSAPIYDEFLNIDFGVTEAAANMWLNGLLAGRAPFARPYTAHTVWTQLYHWYITLAMMHYNFAAYDQAVGWTHHIWLGWHPKHQWMMIKDLDNEIIPLYYIAGKGRRVYAAEVRPGVRQIEVRMPNGSVLIVVSSVSPWEQDIDIVPQRLPQGAHRVTGTVDTCCDHETIAPFDTDTVEQAIRIERLPGYSIAVLRFMSTNVDPRKDQEQAVKFE